jgi:protein-disulfide isomerase
MASRTKQKEEARARRLAEERARAERAQRQRRMRILGGVILIAIVIVGVAVAVSSGGGSGSSSPALGTPAAKQAAAAVTAELSGIPQSGGTLGSPTAKVTVTEYGDLQCPICKDFADGGAKTLIANDVRSGKVQFVYRSLITASSSAPDGGAIFPTQQAAALAAGQQGKAWNYILTFYKLQGQEATGYVNTAFLNGIAKLVPGLNFAQWSSARTSSTLTSQVSADRTTAATLGLRATPAIVVQGPKGQAKPLVGNAGYDALQSAIKSVS